MEWDALADTDTVAATMEALTARGFNATYVDTAQEAVKRLLEMMPAGAKVHHKFSTTLIQMGFVKLLEETDRYDYWAKRIRGESDNERRLELRRQAASSVDYLLGSVNAIARTGEVVVAEASGSGIAGYVYTARRVIWVASAMKIVPTLEDAVRRVRDHALPRENQRVVDSGGAGSYIGKMAIFEREPSPGRISVVLVGERLGF